MTVQRVHLELMSKQRLIALVRTTQQRVDAALAEADKQTRLANYWKGYADRCAIRAQNAGATPADEWEAARLMLAALTPDPDAAEHLRDLEDQVSDDYRESIALGRRRRDLRANSKNHTEGTAA